MHSIFPLIISEDFEDDWNRFKDLIKLDKIVLAEAALTKTPEGRRTSLAIRALVKAYNKQAILRKVPEVKPQGESNVNK